MVIFNASSFIQHYGTPRRSGRYPWGSSGWGDGGDESGSSKRNMTWYDTVRELRSKGLSDKEIYEGMGMSSGQFRARITVEKAKEKQAKVQTVRNLYEKQMSKSEISRQTGIPEPTVRSYLAEDALVRSNKLISTANMLKGEVDRKDWVDVGKGVENHLGITPENLKASIEILKLEGYEVHPVKVPQVGTVHETPFRVLSKPGTTQNDAWLNRDHIQQIDRFSIDGGKTYGKLHPPISVSPDRLAVRWAEEGGTASDGVIYVRPGVPDLSMGGNKYAQVRIMVDNDRYLKGMAIYKDDLPDGVDLMFNTNKSRMDNKLEALKKIEPNPDAPFGTVIRRQVLEDPGGPNERNVSAINLVNEAGAWSSWSKSIASQVLSKQSPALAKERLGKTLETHQKELDEIMSLTNPIVRKKMLEQFATEADAAAVHLKAASLKGSSWHTILPIENMKPTEVFAPNYENGERVALIRYPHGGPFEIPDLIVNNGSRTARKMIGIDSKDAVGIHPSVAERLSGADFDGDTVLVIPNKSGKIKSSPALEGLKGFDPKAQYRLPDDMPGIRDHKNPKATTQRIMGEASNLITDMSIRGAGPEKLARAVAYSMVTIDAEKHHLDYLSAKRKLGINALKAEFQTDEDGKSGGASTLISKASSEKRIDMRKLRLMKDGGPIDKKTGELVYVPANKTYKGKDGQRVTRQEKVERLALTNDAHTLSSGTPMERIYADHSNNLKGLANKARLEVVNTQMPKMSPAAKKVYAKEVESLNSKLHRAQMNAPRERQAQVIANANMKLKRQANPNLDKDQLQKFGYDELIRARKRTGAGKELIDFTPKEWEAIQAGAIASSRVKEMLDNADIDKVKQLAKPRPKTLMSGGNTEKAIRLLASGKYTRAEVAKQLGVSLSTLDRAIDGE